MTAQGYGRAFALGEIRAEKKASFVVLLLVAAHDLYSSVNSARVDQPDGRGFDCGTLTFFVQTFETPIIGIELNVCPAFFDNVCYLAKRFRFRRG